MPRQARLDAPGTLHHVIIRGIEKRNIVKGDKDRDDFVERLGDLSEKTGNAVLAWALMGNHAHILVKSGERGLAELMRRLLTGYAVSFNLRHQRNGYLFQNRYKSIVCQEDAYFKELVRYIHLNPIRAKIVKDMPALDTYPWTGHSALVGKINRSWMATAAVLRWFGRTTESARMGYHDYLARGMDQGRRPELVGGGLVRSKGGWGAVKAMRKAGEAELSDARILGDGEFVLQMMAEAETSKKRQFATREHIQSAVEFIRSACHHQGIAYRALINGSRARDVSQMRKTLAVALFWDHGIAKAEIARQLGVTTSAVARILERHHRDGA